MVQQPHSRLPNFLTFVSAHCTSCRYARALFCGKDCDGECGVLQAMELLRQHATNARLVGVGKPTPVDVSADRGSPHTSDSEMSAVESLTGMKRGRLGHAATAVGAGFSPSGRPRRGAASAEPQLGGNNSGTTGSLKTNSTGCALTAALEGAAAAARRSPPRASGQPLQLDLMRAPGSSESMDASVAGPPLSTAQQHALVNRILVSMGHAPLTSSTLAAIMAKTGPKPASPPLSPPSLVDPSVRGGSGFAMDQMTRHVSGDTAGAGVVLCPDLEQAPAQQVCDPLHCGRVRMFCKSSDRPHTTQAVFAVLL